MKMEFVDEAELLSEEDEMPVEERGKIVLVGEPMGLFIAEETGELEDVSRFSAAVAGAEYNVAVGLSRLGHTAMYCTRLGDDPMGRRILKSMASNGVAADLVTVTDDALTGFMMKGKTDVGDPKIAYFRRGSAASRLSTHDIDKLDLYGCDFLHVTGIFPAVSKSALEAVKRLMARARALDMFISFDPNLRPQLWPDEKEMVRTLNALAQEADLVLPGLGEGKILTKRDTPEGIAEYYHERGVDSVIVKLGADGAYWSTGGEHGTVPAFPVKKIVDTVGAGDGFAAGVISAVAEGLSLSEAAARGTVIGSIQITHKGDNEGLPTREELEAAIQAGIV
ncbi:MAG: sugar kinase [Hominenteromicrobium sp.]